MKKIVDCIWGTVKLCDLSVKFEQTIEFQRLKFIAQLGANHLINTTTMHNRYQHSIGTAFLAMEVCKKLNVDERTSELIQVGALCHDIGHGPLSHMFDKLCEKYNSHYTVHETRSCIIIRYIISKYDIDINETEIQYICDIINPPTGKKLNWKYQIISGKIDVDRMDYIIRDQYCTGIHSTFTKINAMNIIDNLYIDENDNLNFSKSENDIIELINSRTYMYDKVYKSKETSEIEEDIVKIILNNSKFNDIMDNIFMYGFDIDAFIDVVDIDILKIYLRNKY
jgi:putative nucleotidyltransferase with HDIG domain